MHEQWVEIEDFPRYSVSDEGNVRNDQSGHILAKNFNQQGIAYVGLFLDGAQFKRSVALLVAKAFLGTPANENFDTPIHLDGDRSNNKAENLMWRPYWFAIKYHRQFDPDAPKGFQVPIIETGSGRKFDNAMHAATTFGILIEEITYSIVNESYCFPSYLYFKEA